MTYLCIYVIFPYPTLFLIDLLIHPSNSGAPAELHTAIDGMQVVVQPGLYIAQLSTSHDGHGSKMLLCFCPPHSWDGSS